jgi:hypothetical protein
MSSELNQCFRELLTFLRAEEVAQKKRYDNAIDIEDMVEATSVTIDTRTKIQQLRKWIEELQRISGEIDAFFHTMPSSLQTANETLTDVDPRLISAQATEQTSFGLAHPSSVPFEEQDSAGSVHATGRNALTPITIERFSLLGKRYCASEWEELLIKLCEALVLKKPYKIASLGANASMTLFDKPVLSLYEQQIISSKKLSNGLFIDIGGSDNEIKTRCEHILSACGYSSDALQIL